MPSRHLSITPAYYTVFQAYLSSEYAHFFVPLLLVRFSGKIYEMIANRLRRDDSF